MDISEFTPRACTVCSTTSKPKGTAVRRLRRSKEGCVHREPEPATPPSTAQSARERVGQGTDCVTTKRMRKSVDSGRARSTSPHLTGAGRSRRLRRRRTRRRQRSWGGARASARRSPRAGPPGLGGRLGSKPRRASRTAPPRARPHLVPRNQLLTSQMHLPGDHIPVPQGSAGGTPGSNVERRALHPWGGRNSSWRMKNQSRHLVARGPNITSDMTQSSAQPSRCMAWFDGKTSSRFYPDLRMRAAWKRRAAAAQEY